MIPPKDSPRLGSLVSVKPHGREAFVVAISHANPKIYQVQFIEPRGERKDGFGPDDISVLDVNPSNDQRLSAGLRAWITEHS